MSWELDKLPFKIDVE